MRSLQKSEIRFMNLDVDIRDSTAVLAFPKIPGYKIIKLIGQGAHGLVYKGIDKRSHREVAIKVLKPSQKGDKEFLRRFHRELRVVSSLSHPHIIKIYDVGRTGETYFVMEYLKYSLRNLLQNRGGKLPKKEALKIVRRLAKALEYAHSKGVVHRDIKPANILFRYRGIPVLADFGLVRNLNSSSDFTKPHSIMGTPLYMSPEQCRAEKVDHLSDIYSLGVVLFEMLSGKLPYDGKNWADLFRQHIDSAVPIPLLPPSVADCQPLINSMMAKDKNKRINAIHVRQVIDEIVTGKRSQKKWWRQYNYLFFLMAGLIVAFVILVILILLLI